MRTIRPHPFIVPLSASTACSRMMDGVDTAPGYPPYNIERNRRERLPASPSRLPVSARTSFRLNRKRTRPPSRARSSGSTGQNGEVLLSGHRRTRLRACLPARRLRHGEERGASRTGCCTSISSRNPRGQEAASDPDRQCQRKAAGGREQSRRLTDRRLLQNNFNAPDFSGTFLSCVEMSRSVFRRRRCRRRIAKRRFSGVAGGGIAERRCAQRRFGIGSRRSGPPSAAKSSGAFGIARNAASAGSASGLRRPAAARSKRRALALKAVAVAHRCAFSSARRFVGHRRRGWTPAPHRDDTNLFLR